MTRRLQMRVAHKLACARWHLEWSEHSPAQAADGERIGPQQRDSLRESTVFHLVGAYRAFLGEIAADIHLRPVDGVVPDTRSARQLSAAYPDYLPPALSQCLSLEQMSSESGDDIEQCWLALLIRWLDEAEVGSSARSERRADHDLIAASSSSWSVPDGKSLAYCIEQLEALIDRLREGQLEN